MHSIKTNLQKGKIVYLFVCCFLRFSGCLQVTSRASIFAFPLSRALLLSKHTNRYDANEMGCNRSQYWTRLRKMFVQFSTTTYIALWLYHAHVLEYMAVKTGELFMLEWKWSCTCAHWQQESMCRWWTLERAFLSIEYNSAVCLLFVVCCW